VRTMPQVVADAEAGTATTVAAARTSIAPLRLRMRRAYVPSRCAA
jgi:hypothetical protein